MGKRIKQKVQVLLQKMGKMTIKEKMEAKIKTLEEIKMRMGHRPIQIKLRIKKMGTKIRIME